MKIREEQRGTVLTLRLSGICDATAGEQIQTRVTNAQAKKVVIDGICLSHMWDKAIDELAKFTQ